MKALRSQLRKNLNRTALILAPAAIATVADALMTLRGQGAAFWGGNFSAAAEAEPMARPFLALGPIAFLLFVLVYLSIYLAPALVAGCFSRTIAEVCSIHLTITHIIGVLSWCGIFLPGGVPAVDIFAMIPALAWFIFRFQGVSHDRTDNHIGLLQNARLASPATIRPGLS
jgi:hypothetical protein